MRKCLIRRVIGSIPTGVPGIPAPLGSTGAAKRPNSIRHTALRGNPGAEGLGKTNRKSWPQGNADGADDESTVSRAEPVYPKPLPGSCVLEDPYGAQKQDPGAIDPRHVRLRSRRKASTKSQGNERWCHQIGCLSIESLLSTPAPLRLKNPWRSAMLPAPLRKRRKHQSRAKAARAERTQSGRFFQDFSAGENGILRLPGSTLRRSCTV